MMGWLIALGVLILLAFLPLGVSAFYNTDGPRVYLKVGPLRFTLIPKSNKKKKKQGKDKPKAVIKSANSEPSDQGGSMHDFMPLIRAVLELLSELRRRIRVKRLEMKVVLASSDPSDLAINYGRAWVALGNLMPHLERLFVIKKRDLEVECDFTTETTLIYAHIDLRLTLGRAVILVAGHGVRTLREYFKVKNIRKGGANNEPKSS